MPKLTLVASQCPKALDFFHLGEEAYLATITNLRKYRPKLETWLRHHIPTSLRAAYDAGLALSAIRVPKLTLVTSQCPKAHDFFSPMLRRPIWLPSQNRGNTDPDSRVGLDIAY